MSCFLGFSEVLGVIAALLSKSTVTALTKTKKGGE